MWSSELPAPPSLYCRTCQPSRLPGANHFKWKLGQNHARFQTDCGREYVEHWLVQMETMEKDLAFIRNAVVVRSETFAAGQGEIVNYHKVRHRVLQYHYVA